MYQNLNKDLPTSNTLVNLMYREWLNGKNSDRAAAFLHTQYHEIQKNDIALNIKW